MKLLLVTVWVSAEGHSGLTVTYPSPAYTCVQALQPKDTIVAVQRRQEALLKRCTEVNDVLPDFCALVETRYAQMAAKVKTTAPLLKKMQGDLLAIQRALQTMKKRLEA